MSVSQLLKGKIVTMSAGNSVLDGGYIHIEDNLIKGVFASGQLPDNLKSLKVTDTKGVIYPGMMDLHNHFVYNVLPLWVVPKKYANRSQWPGHPEYQSGVSEPIKQVLAKYSESSKAIVRYVEAKALMAGTTTGQGIRTQVKGSFKLFDGAMRNVEEPGRADLPEAGTLVPDLFVGGASGAGNVEAFRRALNRPGLVAYFYHLSEGVDNVSRQHFLDLKDNDLVTNHLVGIHCLGLQPDDLKHCADKGAKLVWSPFSNQLLYGKTLDLKALKESKVLFSIGCDWSPTGSKNLLQELKVAYQTNKDQGNVFSNLELVKAVTISPAQILGWDQKLGSLEVGKIADLVVVSKKSTDVYKNLILAREEDVKLVMVDGVARFGSSTIMKALVSDKTNPPETVHVNGTIKKLYLFSPGSEINDLTFNSALTDLTKILNDLDAFAKSQQQKVSLFQAGANVRSPRDFQLVLDNEFAPDSDPVLPRSAEIMRLPLVKPPMQNSITIDSPFASGADYWQRVGNEKNISSALIAWLKKCYKVA